MAADTTWVSTSIAQRASSQQISPELALVDPVLRRQLLTELELVPVRRPGSVAESPLERPAPASHAEPPANRARGALERTCLAIGWATAAAIIMGSVTLGLAHGLQNGSSSQTGQEPSPLIAIAPYTPPTPQVRHLSATERHRRAELMRLPIRDPFAPQG